MRRCCTTSPQAVGHPRVGGQAVAAGAAGLLVIALDALRQVEVRDEAHVGLVDAHAERDGRDHDDAVLAQEARLVRGARRGVHARRDRAARAMPLPASHAAVSSTLLARQAIDDAGFAGVLVADEAQQLRARVVLVDDACSGCSGRSKLETKTRASSSASRCDDLGARLRVGGGGERDARHAGKALVQHARAAGTPGRKSWPHCDTQCASSMANSASRRAASELEAARRHQPLGRDVEQVELAARAARARSRAPASRVSVELRNAARTPSSASAPTWSCISAISGETTMRRAVAQQRRDLVAQRLAAAGGHQHQRVAAGGDVLDDLAPAAPRKSAIAERLAQQYTRAFGKRIEVGRYDGHDGDGRDEGEPVFCQHRRTQALGRPD